MQEARVLFVDDEINILSSYKRLFRKNGYTIDTCQSPEEAIGFITEKKYQIVVSDQRMPHMQGTEFLEKVRHILPHAKRILLTGYADIQAAMDAINRCGIHHYITKPWNDDELLSLIKSNIEDQAQTPNIEESLLMLSRMGHLRISHYMNHGKLIWGINKKIAANLKLSKTELKQLEIASKFHDIGYIFSDALYNGSNMYGLFEENHPEFNHHVFLGSEIINLIPQLEDASLAIKHHHENYDGTGFPDKLKGDAIPLLSRIIKISSDYDFYFHKFKNQLSPREIIQHMITTKPTIYDKNLLHHLFNALLPSLKNLAEKRIHISELTSGMIISKDLLTLQGALLLPQNSTVNDVSLELIKNHFEKGSFLDEIVIRI